MKAFRSLFSEKWGAKAGKRSRSRLRPAVAILEDRCLTAIDTFIYFNQSPANIAQFNAPEVKEGAKPSKPGFEIEDYSFEIENPATIGSATGGAGAGKIKFKEFVIKHMPDTTSPVLFQNLVVGNHYKTVTIEVRKAGGDPKGAGKPFLQFKFNTVFTTKVNWSGPGDEGPEETITFEYGSFRVKYEKQETLPPVVLTVPPGVSNQPISIPVVTKVPPGSNPPGNPTSGPTLAGSPASGLTLPGCPPSVSAQQLR
jgi:type VI secretion system secreted protein Hcp